MLSVAEVIKANYPSAAHPPIGQDYEVHDNSDGWGPYVSKWNEEKLGPKPTYDQLVAMRDKLQAQIEQQKADDITALKATAERLTTLGISVEHLKSLMGETK